MTTKWIYWFDELTKDSYEMVGKKCANLGEMTRSGLPVPPGFALSIDAYNLFMRETGAAEKVREYLATNPGDLVRDETISRHIREIVESHDLPDRMKVDVSREYQKLCTMVGIPDLPVAVRSSGAVSMPGQMESYLNVRGDDHRVQEDRRGVGQLVHPSGGGLSVQQESARRELPHRGGGHEGGEREVLGRGLLDPPQHRRPQRGC